MLVITHLLAMLARTIHGLVAGAAFIYSHVVAPTVLIFAHRPLIPLAVAAAVTTVAVLARHAGQES